MSHILLLEDDIKLGRQISDTLVAEGYTCDWARDLKNARLSHEKKIPDLYLLDWNLPDGTGIDWAREIRTCDAEAPIIFLTARTDHESAVQALSQGANDFIRKPFGYEELLLRIQRTLKEVIQEKDILKLGPLWVEKNQMAAFYEKTKLKITSKEYQILELLLRKAESVVSRESIVELLREDTNDRTLDSHISRLRKALKDSNANIKISSIYGIGYKLEKEE